MKLKFIVFSTCSFFLAFGAFGQKYPQGKVQQVGIGPYVGYDQEAESVVYGMGGYYEYRPFKRWGFTLGASYDKSPFAKATAYDIWKDLYKEAYNMELPENTVEVKQNQLAVNAGARFYIKRFFFSGALGWSFLDYTVRDTKTGDQEANKINYFYQSYGIGYQWALSDKHQLEPFFNTTTGGVPRSHGTPKIVLGIRYAFRFQ